MATSKYITSWSYSRYQTYKQCPLKAKLKFIDKIKEPPNDAMARGIEIHDKCEKYIKGEIKRIPKELKSFHEEFKKLKSLYGKRAKKNSYQMVVEDNWAFTSTWDQTRWDDWVRCWVRIKLDCAHHLDGETLQITDWKTGKFRPENNEDYIEQLELYALAALLLHDHIQVVKPRLVYIDEGVIYPAPLSKDEKRLTFTRSDIGKLKGLWTKRVGPMMKDKKFPPRANNFCRWCHFRKSNAANGGGQCKY